MGERKQSGHDLSPRVALGLLQEDLRNWQALGFRVLARQFADAQGRPMVVLALPGVVLAQGPDGMRLVLARGTGAGEAGTGTEVGDA